MKKDYIIKILLVVIVLLVGVGVGYLFSNRLNIAEYDLPVLDDDVEYGVSNVDNSNQPTPNIKTDEKTEVKELTDTLTDITYDEFKDLFKSPDKSMVVIVKDKCKYCEAFEPVLEETLKELNLKMYRLNSTNMTTDEKADLANYVYLEGTPTTYVIYNGNVLANLVGSKSKEMLSSFIDMFYLR